MGAIGIYAGDVVELEMEEGPVSALVLLANDAAAIFDPCDGSTPFVLRIEELPPLRVYHPLAAA
jgi:hypothetical protein